MYNENQKKFYLELNTTNTRQMETIFKKSEVVEELLQKDLCEFEFVDYILLFNNAEWCNLNTFRNRKSRISHYLKFCYSNGLCSENALINIKKLTIDDISKRLEYNRTYFKSFSDFNRLIKKAYAFLSDEEKHNYLMNISILYLLWEGFTCKEIADLPIDCIDLEDKTVSGIKIMHDEVFEWLVETANMEYYYKFSKKKVEQIYFTNRQHLIISSKCTKMNENSIKFLVYMLNDKLDKLDIMDEDYGKRFLTTDVYNSGLFERIKRTEELYGIELNAGKCCSGKGNNKVVFNSLMDGRLFTKKELELVNNRKVKEYKDFRKFFYGN